MIVDINLKFSNPKNFFYLLYILLNITNLQFGDIMKNYGTHFVEKFMKVMKY